MQDAPIHCPAEVDATEVEQKACEAPKPGDGMTTQQVPPTPSPKPTPTPTPSPK